MVDVLSCVVFNCTQWKACTVFIIGSRQMQSSITIYILHTWPKATTAIPFIFIWLLKNTQSVLAALQHIIIDSAHCIELATRWFVCNRITSFHFYVFGPPPKKACSTYSKMHIRPFKGHLSKPPFAHSSPSASNRIIKFIFAFPQILWGDRPQYNHRVEF